MFGTYNGPSMQTKLDCQHQGKDNNQTFSSKQPTKVSRDKDDSLDR